jgi:hypothetical protein
MRITSLYKYEIDYHHMGKNEDMKPYFLEERYKHFGGFCSLEIETSVFSSKLE